MHKPLVLQENKPLSDVCTLGIGGPARFFLEVKSTNELSCAMMYAKEKNLPFFILGKGSNCLFDDRGFNGIVILNKIDHLLQNSNIFTAGAGYSFSLLGTQTARKGFSGLEFASGIPGTVGGAVFMNAGANGKETCETITQVEYLAEDGSLKTFYKNDMTFAYRTSCFQNLKGAIVSATFTLEESKMARATQLGIIAHRTKTQPYGTKSAGCMFRNPQRAHAGQLIEQCGLKGTTIGDISVSKKHANFLVNGGSGTCEQLKTLIYQIQKKIKDETGHTLETEVRFVPYE